MSGIRIGNDPQNGHAVVFADTPAGPVSFTLGGPGSEMIQVKPQGGAFAYRGRNYTGSVLLRSDVAGEAYGYGFMLRDAKGATASEAARKGLASILAPVIAHVIETHPEAVAAGIRCAAENGASRVAGDIAAAERELAKMRAELERLRAIVTRKAGPGEDPQAVEAELRNAGRCGEQTAYGMPWSEYCGQSAPCRDHGAES